MPSSIDVEDLAVFANEALGDRLVDLVAAAVAQRARFDVGVDARDQRGVGHGDRLLRLGADEDLEEFVTDRHRVLQGVPPARGVGRPV